MHTLERVGRAQLQSVGARLARVIVFALVYVALGLLSYRVTYEESNWVAAWWAPSGLALATLVQVRRRSLPWFVLAIFLASFAVNARQPLGWMELAVRSTADCLEPLASALLLRRLFGTRMSLGSLREVVGLVAIGALLGPTVGASVATLGVALLSNKSPQEIALFGAIWWGSAFLGVMVFAPALLTWYEPRHLRGRRLAEAGVLVFLLGLLALGLVVTPAPPALTPLIAFMAFPLLAWSAVRFGPAGASRATVALSFISIWPYAMVTTNHPWQILSMQGIYALGAFTGLMLAALTSEAARQKERAEAQARRAEESLAERARLYSQAQAAVQVREDFLSIAAHELKTPLTPLMVRLNFLRKQLSMGASLGPESMDKPLASLRQLTELLNDLLDASRIAHGRLLLHPQPEAIGDIVRSSADAFLGASGRHRIELEVPREPLWVNADRQRLVQVFTNLLDNALKYSPDGGMVRLWIHAEDSLVEVVVSDQGVGIPRENLGMLFDRFFRASNTAGSYGGLGLGLYICRDIVDRHRGRIWAESEPGHGSQFHVTLPLLPRGTAENELH